MDRQTRIKIEDVRSIGQRAREQAAPTAEEVSRTGAVVMIADDLLAMHAQGHSWPRIVKWLNENGIGVSERSLQQALRRVRAKKKKEAKGVPPRAARAAKGHGASPAAAPGGASRPTERPSPRSSPRPGGEERPAAPMVRVPPATGRGMGVSRPSSPQESPPEPGTFIIRPDTPDL